MVRREAPRGRVLREIGQPQGHRIADEFAEQSVPGGQRADGPDLLVGHSHRDELRECAVLTDHSERTVLRVDEQHRRFRDALQHL